MIMIDQVECEMEALQDNFKKLLSLEKSLQENISNIGPKLVAANGMTNPVTFSPQSFVASIRPYILWSINSTVVFRLAELCDFQKRIKNLTVDYTEVHRTGFLDAIALDQIEWIGIITT